MTMTRLFLTSVFLLFIVAAAKAEEPPALGESDLLGDWYMTTVFDNEIASPATVETLVRYSKAGKAQVSTSITVMGAARTTTNKGSWKIKATDAKKQMLLVEASGMEKGVVQQMLLRKLSADRFQIVTTGDKVSIPTDEEWETLEGVLKKAGVQMYLTRASKSKK